MHSVMHKPGYGGGVQSYLANPHFVRDTLFDPASSHSTTTRFWLVYLQKQNFQTLPYPSSPYLRPLFTSISCLFSLGSLAQGSVHFIQPQRRCWPSFEFVMFSAFNLFVSLLYVRHPCLWLCTTLTYLCQPISISSPGCESVRLQQASTNPHTPNSQIDITRCHCRHSFNRRGRGSIVGNYSQYPRNRAIWNYLGHDRGEFDPSTTNGQAYGHL